MRGIMADVNIEGHIQSLVRFLRSDSWKDFWDFLNLRVLTFADVGLDREAPDDEVWKCCQRNELTLLTTNRNQTGEHSLETAIRNLNRPDSLPVFTISNGEHFRTKSIYRQRVAVKVLEYLLEINLHRGTGRLWVP